MGKMRIGLNLIYLRPTQSAGLSTYALGLLKGLQQVSSPADYVILTSRQTAQYLRNRGLQWRFVEFGLRPGNPVGRLYYEQFILPLVLRKEKLDCLHSLAYWGSIPYGGSSVVTVPDLNAIDIPESVSRTTRLLWPLLVGESVRRAKRVITISEFSKARLVREFGLNPDHVAVTHLAPKPDLRRVPDTEAKQCISRYELQSGYILSVASYYPHKKLDTLIEAYELLLSESHGIPDLVLAGYSGNAHVSLMELVNRLGLSGKVHFTGFVPEEHLAALYQEAKVFVFPSSYEGFGMPVLEAMSFGVPVVLSSAAALPEVGGDAAVYADVGSAEDMARRIGQVLEDEALRLDLISGGYENIKRFSWEQTAAQTRQIYEECSGK